MVSVAARLGVSERGCVQVVERDRERGERALRDRSSRPLRCPHQTPERSARRMLQLLRVGLVEWEIAKRTGVPPSTVSGLLQSNELGC